MNALFDNLDNVFGALKPDIRKRLRKLIDKPTTRTWDDAYSIIINGGAMRTLWQAVIAVDPTFPRTGPRTDKHGTVLQGWARVPDHDTIIKALLLATKTGSRQ